MALRRHAHIIQAARRIQMGMAGGSHTLPAVIVGLREGERGGHHDGARRGGGGGRGVDAGTQFRGQVRDLKRKKEKMDENRQRKF